MSNDVNSVFDAFVQAKEALEKVPELETKLLEANNRGDVLYQRLNNAENEAYAKAERIRELEAQLEAKGVIPGYLAYVIIYKQWTGGDNGDRSVALST